MKRTKFKETEIGKIPVDWDELKIAGKEFPEQKQRIAEKKAQLEAMGGQIDTSHIIKPEMPKNVQGKGEKLSMWDTMQLAQQKINAHKEYLDKLEKAYDDALARVKAEGPPSKTEEEKVYSEKKAIVKE